MDLMKIALFSALILTIVLIAIGIMVLILMPMPIIYRIVVASVPLFAGIAFAAIILDNIINY